MTQCNASKRQDLPSCKNMIIFTSALVILLIISTIFFGFYVFLVALVAILCAFIVEIVFVKIRKVEFDKFFVISPLVLTMMMPPRIELWVVAVGSLFGVFFGKAVFGGYGKNVFNPAVVGVLFVTISFPSLVTAANWIHPSIDGFSGATPLSMLNSGGDFTYLFKDLLLGNVPGSIGETFRLGIIIIGVVLIVLKVIDWRIPSVYLLSMFILTGIGYLISPTSFPNPILSLFVGGLLFAAFFVATDPITSPINPKGKIFFAIGLAFFTILIRYFATFQEGIVFAIIIMNAIAPLIDDGLEKNNDVKANLEEEVSQ